jgi:hypothetical protein
MRATYIKAKTFWLRFPAVKLFLKAAMAMLVRGEVTIYYEDREI